ncbi:glycoside hydrolase family 92 protein [candidate division KSB1 bacterium]|nr:glycoside hydrolase family 92 protein [candidate division KSB1 bacterium]
MFFCANIETFDDAEGNAWQGLWLAPHDVNGLIDLFGGSV